MPLDMTGGEGFAVGRHPNRIRKELRAARRALQETGSEERRKAIREEIQRLEHKLMRDWAPASWGGRATPDGSGGLRR